MLHQSEALLFFKILLAASVSLLILVLVYPKCGKALIPTEYCCCKDGCKDEIRLYLTEKVIHFASNRASSGDGPEVYAEMLTKNLTPYVTTQVRCLDISGHLFNFMDCRRCLLMKG